VEFTFGIGSIAHTLLPDGFVEVPAAEGLPELGELDLVLLRSARAASKPAEALTAAILASGRPLSVGRGS
jgi:hypothetical protein